ncbi:hypothetical protein [Desertibacillus haloalkaliphilus]|uniref:hypothetical protein n=1 Tax=Desertibacillus haloalkaliphilus TaxID=1328930 RepID=UPI001C261D56|nr:hypothetical protein [Desertibacillus haloalkaliphilus]MBU8907145.1 hypothetical protein [Desertibacillus haloalkaliphilus]
MLVAAIVLPALFLTFFIIVKRDQKEHIKKWEQIGTIEEAKVLSGQVSRFHIDKKRFYQSMFIWSIELMISNDAGQHKVIIEQPMKQENQPLTVKANDLVVAFGQWQGDYFYANRVEIKNEQP